MSSVDGESCQRQPGSDSPDLPVKDLVYQSIVDRRSDRIKPRL
jgi:hypothetical protein